MLADRPSRRRLLVPVAVGAAALAVLAAVGGYGLVAGPPQPTPPRPRLISSSPSPGEHPAAAVTQVPSPDRPPALPHTADPVVYARAVAAALFTWGTGSGLAPGDYAWPVIADGDPSGHETPGLAADVAGYLPAAEVWQQLRRYATTQSLTIRSASVPGSWHHIAAAAADQLRPGTVAVTVQATRHRAGVWLGRPASSHQPVGFTVFLACPPAFDRCHALRLSQLDNPLP